MRVWPVGVAVAMLAGDLCGGEAERHVRLELDLVDGSRIIGTPAVGSVPLQTPYAKMDIPLDQIAAIQMGEDHEKASVGLQNGDKIQGVIDLKPIELETVFGKVAIQSVTIRELRVLTAGGPLPEALRQGLILRYTFEHDAGTSVCDDSGHQASGEAEGPVPVSGTTARGAFVRHFDGTNDQILVRGEAPFRFAAQDFTIAMRICPSVLGQYRRTLASKYAFDKREWVLMLHPDGRLQFGTSSGRAGGDLERNTAASAIKTGEWHHVAVVKKGPEAGFYVDGRRQPDDGTAVHAVLPSFDEPVRLGAYRGGDGTIGNGQHLFCGDMDDVTIYSRALSADEVEALSR